MERGSQTQAQLPQEEEIDLKEILFRYLTHWKFIGAFIVGGIVLAFLFNKLSTPIYRIEATLLIKDEDKGMLGGDLFEKAGLNMSKSNVENEMGILKSYTLLSETLQNLNFNVTYFESRLLKNQSLYKTSPIYVEVDWNHPQNTGGMLGVEKVSDSEFRLSIEKDKFYLYNPIDPNFKTEIENVEIEEGNFSFGEELSGATFKFSISDLGLEEGQKILFQIRDTPSLVAEYRELLEVAPSNKSSTLLNLSLNLDNRKKGEDFLNTLMTVYLERELNEKNRSASNTINFIESQLSGITDSLSFIEDRLESFRSSHNVFNLNEEGALIFHRLEELEEEKSKIELSLSYYKSMEEYLNEDQLGDLISPSFIGIQDPLLNALVISLAELQGEKVRLTATFSDQTPAVREVNSKIRNTQKALAENLRNAIKNAESSLKELNNRIARTEREVNRLPATERNLLSIQRQFSINENIYIYLLEKRAEAEITRASNNPTHTILDPGRSHYKPVFPKPLISYLVGMFLGTLLPIGWITARDIFNTKIQDPQWVERKLSVPLAGFIGLSKFPSNLIVFKKPRSIHAESFRNLRANMGYLSPKQDSLVIALSSAISGEGKTFCSINLASIYAISGKKCILVGLDLRKPRIAEDFSLTNDKGVSTYLSKRVDWKKLIKPSGHENLDILLSGPIPPNPAELIIQPKFDKLIEELKNQYDIVILDCPPVGLVSETLEIFKKADINLMVLRHNYSEKSACEYINSLPTQNGVQKLYVILNGLSTKANIGGYGKYGYGTGYGYSSNGYGYHEEDKKDSLWEKAKKTISVKDFSES